MGSYCHAPGCTSFELGFVWDHKQRAVGRGAIVYNVLVYVGWLSGYLTEHEGAAQEPVWGLRR